MRGYYKRTSGDFVWVRYISFVENDLVNYLEYISGHPYPHKGTAAPSEFDPEYWEQISNDEAYQLVPNMGEQNQEHHRLNKRKGSSESLAKALCCLEHKTLCAVRVVDGVVRITAENGEEYDLTIHGNNIDNVTFQSRQICESDPR